VCLGSLKAERFALLLLVVTDVHRDVPRVAVRSSPDQWPTRFAPRTSAWPTLYYLDGSYVRLGVTSRPRTC
jgi:hypothetical protein